MLKRRRKLATVGAAAVTGFVTILVVTHAINNLSQNYPTETNHHEQPTYARLFQSQNESLDYPLGDLPANDTTTLFNITNFKYLINNNVCATEAPIVAFVHSAPKNIPLRSRIRRTWGQELPLVFLLGETSKTFQKQIEAENSAHHDIVQGSFVDAYRNLTYKHLMGFKWVLHHCPGAKYILKTDDDVLVNVLFLRKYIVSNLSPAGVRNLVLCHRIHAPVLRDSRSKWSVSAEEYKDSWYPPQCLGWAILYSRDVIFRLYNASKKVPFFWIDDIYVTAILTSKLNITLSSANPFVIYEPRTKSILRKPCLEPEDDFLFAYPGGSIHETETLWEIVKNTTRYL